MNRWTVGSENIEEDDILSSEGEEDNFLDEKQFGEGKIL